MQLRCHTNLVNLMHNQIVLEIKFKYKRQVLWWDAPELALIQKQC
jgi:hypothetical protein